LNKKRDALRRGIRDLLKDTSRDLVDFEGREPAPYVEPPGPPARDAARQAQEPGPAFEPPALNGGPADVRPETAPAVGPPAAPAEPSPALEPCGAHPERDPDSSPGRFTPVSETASGETAAHEPIGPSGTADTARAAAPRSLASPAAPAKRSPAAKRSKPERPARKAPRARTGARERTGGPGGEAAHGEGGPTEVRFRTGVCRSYFINHECWHVPNAYCNTALQVCVIRNCPVYHLHKDALEHRFAKKFKHFW
jgi:hypothetical protein